MFTITMTSMFLASIFILIPFLQYCDAAAVTYWSYPSSVTGIQGQSITITFVANLSDHNPGTTWRLVRIMKDGNQVISIKPGEQKVLYGSFVSRSSDLDLNVTQNDTIVTIKFTYANLVKATDEGAYTINPFGTSDFEGGAPTSPVSLSINVSPAITSPNPSPGTVTVNETQTAQLVCNATGHPTPSINWTRDGVIVGTGSPFTTPVVSYSDDKACYTCIAYNGILDAKTANVCLNVQYKPRSTLRVVSDKSTVCQNDKVNLTCTSGPANPAPSSYDFYDNGVLIGTSASNVYEATATEGLPAVNSFVCVPRNLLGSALENASVEVSAKVAPRIVTSPQATTVVEGSALTLFCNASGTPAPNITWTKVGGSNVGNSETYTIISVTRGDEDTYRCTATNGDECSNVTADAAVIVNYPPENTAISTNQSENTFLKGNSVKLSCVSTSKPQLCNVTFYHGNTVLQSYSDKTCAGVEAASHVIQNIDGCNLEEYSCKVENQYGQQEAKVNLTIKVPATIAISPAADVVIEEGNLLHLNCTATGCPTPNITWTKIGNSGSLQVGNGFFLSHHIGSLSKSDTGSYKCSVDNGVVGSPVNRTIYVNVTYKPEATTLTSSKTNTCLNDQVTLSCTTDANPPVYEYRFYLNDVLVHTSISGVYQFNVPQAGNNTYKCEPKNTVGAGQNATTSIETKAPPNITFSTPDQTVVEGSSVVLMCNVSGSDPMNVTWSRVGGSSYPEGYSHTFSSIGRADEAKYQCTAHNGNECPVATATSSITVNYKPENTRCFTNKSSNVFLQGETVNLTCQSTAKPSQCNVLFYQGNQLLANKSSSTCSASHLLTNIQGCNSERLWFYAENIAGTGNTVDINITVQVPANMSVTPSTNPVIIEEGQALSLNCNATGCPTPNITWTKNGVAASLASENTFFLSHDFSSINKVNTGHYKCSVDNGVVGSPLERTIYVNVTYKPKSTNLISTLSNSCLNDSVTLQCTTDANPPVYEYRFYLNDALVHTSVSGTYQFNVPQAGNNTYKCEPKNTIGAGQNATVTIATKAAPQITFSTPDQTVVEGSPVVLMCNVSGSDPMNVTWSRFGGSSYPEGYSHNFSSIGRADEATYQCTAHNGNECPVATATSSITVIYKPENTNLTASIATACKGESLTLTCDTHAKPAPTTYRFYENEILIHTQSTNSYTFALDVSGFNRYKCVAENSAGNGTSANATVNVKVAPVITYVTPSQDVVEDNSLTLVCNVTDQSGALNVSWHKQGVGRLSTTNTYTLASAGRGATGSYVCKAHNGNECDAQTKNISITVIYPAAIASHSNLNVNSSENDQITLICRVSGLPAPIVNWTRNGQLINSAHGETYSFNGLESLSGNYSCVVGNGVGALQHRTFGVKIKGYCKNHRCKHGGKCRSQGQGYECLCTRGLTGGFCEIEDPVHTEFVCLLVILKPQWKDGYGVAKSPDFNDLELKICTKMFLIFNGRPMAIRGRKLVGCKLKSARKGSTFANTELTFNDTALRSEVLDAINSGIVNQTIFGNLTLRSSALEVQPKTDPCSSEPCKFNTKCVAKDNGYRCECDAFRYGMHCEKGIGLIPGIIIILACIFIIIIIIILCVLYCKKKKSETYPAAAAENGTHEMKAYHVSDHRGAASNAHVITSDEKPPVKNGQPLEVYRTNHKEDVIYTELSFKKFNDPKKENIGKQPTNKSETIYADILSFQQNTEEKPKDATLAEEAIELNEKEPEKTNTEPEKETKIDGGDENDGSKPNDDQDSEGTGASETSGNPENQYSPSPPTNNQL